MVGDIGSIELDREGVPECRSVEAEQSDPWSCVCSAECAQFTLRILGSVPGTSRGRDDCCVLWRRR